MIQLSEGSMSGIEDFESKEQNDARSMGLDVNDPRYVYCDKTWRQDHSTYDPSPIAFEGISSTIIFLNALLTILQLWKLFWPCIILREIVRETNQYVGPLLMNLRIL